MTTVKPQQHNVKIILPVFYRNLVVFMLLSSALLVFGIFYFVLGSVKIRISTSFQKVVAEEVVDIRALPFDSPIEEGPQVRGKFYEYTLHETFAIPASGRKEVDDGTVGVVTIVNTYSRDQALVETTRLLSPDNVLVRTRNSITVPAGGRVDVAVYADDPDSFSRVLPSRFIIPGLWEGLQDKIYAENSEPLEKGGRTISIVTEKDVENIEQSISEKVDEIVRGKLENDITPEEELFSKLIQKEVLSTSVNAAVGDERQSVEALVSVRATVVVFDEAKLLTVLRKKLSEKVPSGKRLAQVDADSLIYSIEKYDPQTKTASVKAYAEGSTILDSSSKLFDKSELYGMGRKQLVAHFQEASGVESVEVEFSPAWIHRVPGTDEKIEIIFE